MAKDYKSTHRAARQRPPKARWFVSGFALGATVSALVLVTYEVSGVVGEWVNDLSIGDQRSRESSVVADQSPVSKPKFQFYDILPEMEVAVPESEVAAPAPAEESSADVAALDQPYVLQVGSFRDLSEADRQKATLALIGLEADIQTVSIDGEETWHRVRLGPYQSLDTLNEARGRLYENHIDTIVYKLKD